MVNVGGEKVGLMGCVAPMPRCSSEGNTGNAGKAPASLGLVPALDDVVAVVVTVVVTVVVVDTVTGT
jgi:hypothetical protein